MSNFNFIVKSKINNYSVEFISNIEYVLQREIKSGDYIIIDKKL